MTAIVRVPGSDESLGSLVALNDLRVRQVRPRGVAKRLAHQEKVSLDFSGSAVQD